MQSLLDLLGGIAESMQISCHLPLTHPQTGFDGTRVYNVIVMRRKSSCHSIPHCPIKLLWHWTESELHIRPEPLSVYESVPDDSSAVI